jgi:hypothetical protein
LLAEFEGASAEPEVVAFVCPKTAIGSAATAAPSKKRPIRIVSFDMLVLLFFIFHLRIFLNIPSRRVEQSAKSINNRAAIPYAGFEL